MKRKQTLQAARERQHRRDMKLVNAIQDTRARNNINWMDLLRIALTHSPSETKKVLRRIHSDDGRISDLLRKLGE